MDWTKMLQKGGMAIFTYAVAYLASNPQVLTHLIPSNIGNMSIGAAVGAIIVMAANWLKNKNTPAGSPQV